MRERWNPWVVGAFVLGVAAVAVPALAAEVETTEPHLLMDSWVAAEYPPAALAVRFEGSVTVAAHVAPDGSVADVDVLESTHPKVGFEAAAISAVEQWRFDPARVGDVAVDSVAVFRLSFDNPGPGLNRDYPTATGEYLMSRLVVAGSSARQTSASIGQGYQTASANRGMKLFKPNLPPGCLGCMYDRRHILPHQVRGAGNVQQQ